MRKEMQRLFDQIDSVDSANLYQAIADLKRYMQTLVEWMDAALPDELEE